MKSLIIIATFIMLFSCQKTTTELKATGKSLRQQKINPATTAFTKPAHIFFIWMENHGYNSIIGSSNAPYIDSLVQRGTLFTNTYALAHPSQPNYIRFFLVMTTELLTITALLQK